MASTTKCLSLRFSFLIVLFSISNLGLCFDIFTANLAFGDPYLEMQCRRYVEPINPSKECKYGFYTNECQKISCYKGPDEECQNEPWMLTKRCVSNLRCCGICIICVNGKCAQGMCPSNSKRTSLKSSLMPDSYERQEEKRHFLELQREEKRRILELRREEERRLAELQREEERRRQQQMTLPKDLIEFKPNMERSQYPPLNYIEYSLNNDN